MASKQFQVDGLGEVTISKRKSSRSLRLSVSATGAVRVTIPAWSAYATGLSFVQSRLDWILAQRPAEQPLIHNQAVGKYHRLVFEPAAVALKPTSRLKQNEVIVRYPLGTPSSDPAVQKVAREACVRALRDQAERLLPQRLAQLAGQHDFRYGSISVKRLKGRWGSCDQQQNIVLNLFLMQLPWDCIDYVLLHELTHTKVLRHGPPFWAAMAEVVPRLPAIRKQMRSYQPVLLGPLQQSI